ncbi:MAG: hypothetical protein JO256_08475 [Alphaproteobacteria bacterium]|nr:hypothetical protein [Alphaproteobacteria bacterium]
MILASILIARLSAARSKGHRPPSDRLVAVKRKRGGSTPLELGLKGGNTYRDMWAWRDIYQ